MKQETSPLVVAVPLLTPKSSMSRCDTLNLLLMQMDVAPNTTINILQYIHTL